MLPTLHRSSLKGLHTLSVRANLVAEGCDGSFFPVLKSKIERNIEDLLHRQGLNTDHISPIQLTTEVRTRILNHQIDSIIATAKIETTLREPVTILRNSLSTVVDTWRHIAVIGIYSGVPNPTDLTQLIENEAARQVEVFLADCQLNGNTIHGVDEVVLVESPRVQKAKELLDQAAVYPNGCSDFVCKVLGIPHENANALMGASPTYIGDNFQYPGLVPGDIVGWTVGGGQGHVAMYVGEPGKKFIDVKEPGAKPRPVIRGYGNGRPLFKSTRF